MFTLKVGNKVFILNSKILERNSYLNLINQANAEVAILCNHQKAISKSFKNQLDKMDETKCKFIKNMSG